MKFLLTSLLFVSLTLSHAMNTSVTLKDKAKDASNKQSNLTASNTTEKYHGENKTSVTSSANKDIKTVEGTWKVDGVIVTTENEALKPQITLQEEQYNAAYKGSIWTFKKDGTIAITLPKSASSPGGTSAGKYEVKGEKVLMVINNQPAEYDLKFEDGQMLLINSSPLNTLYYVFVKG